MIARIKRLFENQIRILAGLKEERINKLKKGDPLPSGVIKMVKVYIAMKRHVSVGDKVAGRHGNKGVVSLLFLVKICHILMMELLLILY